MLGLKHKMWVNDEGAADMASLGDSSNEHHVHFNDAKEDAFIVCDWDDIEGKNSVKFPWNCILNSCSCKFLKSHLEQPHEEVDKKM